jgi:hypothetical protein
LHGTSVEFVTKDRRQVLDHETIRICVDERPVWKNEEDEKGIQGSAGVVYFFFDDHVRP